MSSKKSLIILFVLVGVVVLSLTVSYQSIKATASVAVSSSMPQLFQIVITPPPNSSVVDDDLSFGKSCEYRSKTHRWICRDCGVASSVTKKCQTIQPRKQCAPFPLYNTWAEPTVVLDPLQQSNGFSVPTRTMTFFGKYVYEHQPLCTVSTCWDLDKCHMSSSSNIHSSNITLNVFVNVTGPHVLLDAAVTMTRQRNIRIQRVDRYQDACLVLVTKDMYDNVQAMKGAEHWKRNGRNHFLWDLSRFGFLVDNKRLTSDAPLTLFHVEYAAVASESLSNAYMRFNYDFALPLDRRWGRQTASVDIHRPRKWLLSFRGNVQNTLHPHYHYRWLAAEYWEDNPDVIIDVQCKRSKRKSGKYIEKPYNLPASVYDDMMWNSTFGFAPGGSGIGSYRFGEILSTGGIPVVTPDFVPPLHPEIDWSGCVVRVSLPRVIDLPRILRNYSKDQVRQRQRVCWHLLQTVIGDKQDGTVWRHDKQITFTKAMEIWAIRIANALELTNRLGEIS